jgi:hypothetical protein
MKPFRGSRGKKFNRILTTGSSNLTTSMTANTSNPFQSMVNRTCHEGLLIVLGFLSWNWLNWFHRWRYMYQCLILSLILPGIARCEWLHRVGKTNFRIYDVISQREFVNIERKICREMSRYILHNWLKLQKKSLVSFWTMDETKWHVKKKKKCSSHKGFPTQKLSKFFMYGD